jgi:hypothetical protein
LVSSNSSFITWFLNNGKLMISISFYKTDWQPIRYVCTSIHVLVSMMFTIWDLQYLQNKEQK